MISVTCRVDVASRNKRNLASATNFIFIPWCPVSCILVHAVQVAWEGSRGVCIAHTGCMRGFTWCLHCTHRFQALPARVVHVSCQKKIKVQNLHLQACGHCVFSRPPLFIVSVESIACVITFIMIKYFLGFFLLNNFCSTTIIELACTWIIV